MCAGSPADLFRLLPLLTLPSDCQTRARGLLWLKPLLGPMGSCTVWLGHSQRFACPGGAVHLSPSTPHTSVSQGISFLPLAAVIWHTPHPNITQDHEHWAFCWLSDKALKKETSAVRYCLNSCLSILKIFFQPLFSNYRMSIIIGHLSYAVSNLEYQITAQ